MPVTNTDVAGIAVRENKASINKDRCLRWLDSMKPSSVVCVSFGNLVHAAHVQLVETGLGLEASNCPFIWVSKAEERFSEVEQWLSEFKERTRRWLVIRGWAPGNDLITSSSGRIHDTFWMELDIRVVPKKGPHFGDQFLNEKLIVEILRIRVLVGVKDPTIWCEEIENVLVKKDDTEKCRDRGDKKLW